MKKRILIVTLFFFEAAVLAQMTSYFSSWNNLVEVSPAIVIARCTDTPSAKGKNTEIEGGVILSKIEIVSVLKGDVKLGLDNLQSWYWPYRGEQLLIFANGYSNDQFYKGYDAFEEYRIIPLSRDFKANVLAGKTLTDQIQLILSNRLQQVNEELKNDSLEKLRLEDGLRKKGDLSGTSSNLPPAEDRPQGKGHSF